MDTASHMHDVLMIHFKLLTDELYCLHFVAVELASQIPRLAQPHVPSTVHAIRIVPPTSSNQEDASCCYNPMLNLKMRCEASSRSKAYESKAVPLARAELSIRPIR